MKLYEAIKLIVQQKGRNFVTQRAFINCIDDYHGFEENLALKYVLGALCQSRFLGKLLKTDKIDVDIEVWVDACVLAFKSVYGFEEARARYTFYSMAYGLGLMNKEPLPLSVISKRLWLFRDDDSFEVEKDDFLNVDEMLAKLDPLFEQVARLVVKKQQGSTSMIQRLVHIGYNRAGFLMDQLERAGIVGPVQGCKPREVLVHNEEELDKILTALHH